MIKIDNKKMIFRTTSEQNNKIDEQSEKNWEY